MELSERAKRSSEVGETFLAIKDHISRKQHVVFTDKQYNIPSPFKLKNKNIKILLYMPNKAKYMFWCFMFVR